MEISTIIQLKWRFKTQEAPQHEMVKTKQEIKLHEVEWKKKPKTQLVLAAGGQQIWCSRSCCEQVRPGAALLLERRTSGTLLFSSLRKTSLKPAAKQYCTIIFEVIIAIVIVRLWINLPLNAATEGLPGSVWHSVLTAAGDFRPSESCPWRLPISAPRT